MKESLRDQSIQKFTCKGLQGNTDFRRTGSPIKKQYRYAKEGNKTVEFIASLFVLVKTVGFFKYYICQGHHISSDITFAAIKGKAFRETINYRKGFCIFGELRARCGDSGFVCLQTGKYFFPLICSYFIIGAMQCISFASKEEYYAPNMEKRKSKYFLLSPVLFRVGNALTSRYISVFQALHFWYTQQPIMLITQLTLIQFLPTLTSSN